MVRTAYRHGEDTEGKEVCSLVVRWVGETLPAIYSTFLEEWSYHSPVLTEHTPYGVGSY
jgi:hypothetical protein